MDLIVLNLHWKYLVPLSEWAFIIIVSVIVLGRIHTSTDRPYTYSYIYMDGYPWDYATHKIIPFFKKFFKRVAP